MAKNSSTRKTSEFPYPGTLFSGQTRYYRTQWTALSAIRNSFKTAGEPWRKPQKPMRRVNPKRTSAELAYPFHDSLQKSEQRFLRFVHSLQMKVGRNGWPDFYCESAKGGRAAVEVKNGSDDPLRPEQAENFAFLERLGVNVFIFNPAWSSLWKKPALIPWREYHDSFDVGWPGTDPGGQAAGRSTTSAQQDLELKPAHENPAPENGRTPELLGDPRLLN